jgi:predicted nucleotidyltransferase
VKAKYGEGIERIVLFGSVARGDYREGSDVDMLIVAHDTSWAFRLRLAAEATEVLLREGVYISAKPISPEDFAEMEATLFGLNVRREGLVLA